MGVLNVTPDSFSDGGRYLDPKAAIDRGRQMIDEGASVVDVGGESSRPGARTVDETEEIQRVLPVIEELARDVRISIDTIKPAVARAALEAGATLINDISASLWPIAAEYEVGWVAMHMQGTPVNMQINPHYENVVREVGEFLREKANLAIEAGVKEIWLDPGFGFGKGRTTHNLELLCGIEELVEDAEQIGVAGVLVGTSRKSFIGDLGKNLGDPPLNIDQRLEGSLATVALAVLAGVSMVRVHDVKQTWELVELIGAKDTVGSVLEVGADAGVDVALGLRDGQLGRIQDAKQIDLGSPTHILAQSTFRLGMA